MSTHDSRPVLVAGAGIGGLTAALALSRHGFTVEVYERRAEKEIELAGTGLTIWSNATTALAALGVGDQLLDRGDPIVFGRNVTEKGTEMLHLAIQEWTWPDSTPGVSINRGDLVRILMNACEDNGVVIHLDRRCVDYEHNGDGVRLRLESGEQVEGRALVGADGIRSKVRERLLGGAEPVYTGVSTYRGISDDSGGVRSGEVFLFRARTGASGGGWHVADGRLAWTVGRRMPAGGRDEPGTAKDRVLEMLAGTSGPPRKFVEATPDDRIIRTDIYYHDWQEKRSEGVVALIGDAAQALPTVLGQGACQAIEDGVVLADSLARADTVADGMRAYQLRRVDRVRWVREQVFNTWRMSEFHIPGFRWLLIRVGRVIAARKQPEMWRALQKPPEQRLPQGRAQ